MRFLIPFLVLFFSVTSFAQSIKESSLQIWKVGDRRWTVEEEHRFGKWVEKNITEDFFIRYKIPIDCADVTYAVRWIYARIAHLPAAATTKDGQWIGHWSTEWGKLPTHSAWHKDLRFRKALLHMLWETTTRTLPFDTYPVRIDDLFNGVLCKGGADAEGLERQDRQDCSAVNGARAHCGSP